MKPVIAAIALLLVLLLPAFPQDTQTPTADYIAELRQKAEQGDAEAQFSLGLSYQEGRGVPQDPKAAAEWYLLAARQEYPRAYYNLGVLRERGEGLPLDHMLAYVWFSLAAGWNITEANEARKRVTNVMTPEQIGKARYHVVNMAMEWRYCCFPQEALRLLTTMAEEGYAPAQHQLGLIYASGKEVAQDYDESVHWTRLAAKQGYSEAQLRLGEAYDRGTGVLTPDPIQAYLWLTLAASGGYENNARLPLEELTRKMTPEQIAEAQRLAREWKPNKEGP